MKRSGSAVAALITWVLAMLAAYGILPMLFRLF